MEQFILDFHLLLHPPVELNKEAHLLLAGLGSGLGDLASVLGLVNRLDDTDGDGLPHVPDGESAEGSVRAEGLDAHGLGRDHLDDGGITGLDLGGSVLDLLTRSPVDLLDQGGELAGNMGGVAIQDGGVTLLDLTRVVQDDDLSVESLGLLGGVVFGVGADVTPADVLDGDVLDVETDVVTWDTLVEGLVMHLDGFDLSGDGSGGEGDDHTGLDDTGLDSADGHCSDTTDLVDVLEGQPEGLVRGPGGGHDSVQSLEEGVTGGLLHLAVGVLALDGPSFVPGHVGGLLDHVITVPARNGDESNGLGVVTDLLDVVGDLLGDFLESLLGVLGLGGVHLVTGDDELLDTEGVGEESVLPGLAVLGDTGLELTDTGGDDQDGAVSLGSTGNHVLDEIPMAWGVNDGDLVLGGLKLPEGDIDGDTTFPLGLQLVEDPSVLERPFAHLGGFLLELLDGPLVDTTTFVDEVTGGGGFTGVDVADDDDVDMGLSFTHFRLVS